MSIEQDVEKRLEDFDLETGKEKETTPPTVEKPALETAKPPVTEDPEFDLGEGKKAKLSQIKDWEKGSMLQSDYTKKTTELAEQRKEVQDLVNLANFLKANPEKLKKVIAVLEDKVEEAKEKIEEKLEDLDPNDPYAKPFSKLLSQIDSLHKRLDTYEQKEVASVEEGKVVEAQQVLTKTLEDTVKELKFDDFDNDEEVKGFWRNSVLSYLKDHPKNYADANDFVNTIKEIGKKYFDGIVKIGEVKLKKYLTSKNVPPPAIAPTATGVPVKKETKPDMDNLQDVLQREFDEVEKQTA